MKKNRSFTLIELLIATAIISVVLLSLYSAFQTGMRTYKMMDSSFNIYQTARILFNRMEVDLKNSFAYRDDNSEFKGGKQSLEFFSDIERFKDGKSYPAICRIKYELDGKKLNRSLWEGLEAAKEVDVKPEELSQEIEKISFQYAHATKDPDKPIEWLDSWPKGDDAEQVKVLPLAVKVDLSIGTIQFTKLIALPVGEITK